MTVSQCWRKIYLRYSYCYYYGKFMCTAEDQLEL